MPMLNLAELTLLALAGYRGTQLIVFDTVLDAPRTVVFNWHGRETESAVRAAAVTLISCIYCMGFWVSGAFLAAYLYASHQWHGTPLVVHGIEWFAVAGGQALLSVWDNSRKDDE